MPGLTGLSAARAPALLDAMTRELVREPWLDAHRLDPTPPGRFACLALGHSDMAGVAERGDAALAVAGWVLDTEETGARLADWLLARFLAEGERFVERLSGSFQIAVRQRGTTYLYADPLGSRRLFYAELGAGLCFSPEVAPLMALLGSAPADPANLVQFLISGRFFAGGSALAPVRQLLPGEYLVHGPRLSRHRYFRYEIRPHAAAAEEETAERLAALLERAVLRAWRRARRPAFLLSGGYDSRFIFYTVARAVRDTTRLRTVIWAAHLERPLADARTAATIARRFGTRHLEIECGVDRAAERFDAMFRSQSGMTEQTLTHVDEPPICRALRREHGIESIFRGDEVFGPKGAEVASVQAALERLSMSRTSRVADRTRWFQGGGEAYLEAHAEHLERLLAEAPSAPADLRDTLYARERLPALQHHLGYQRSHHLETYNPLLDLDVVRFYRGVRAADRLDKRLFKAVFERRFGHHLDVPIASRDNGVDLARVVRRSPPLAAFLRRSLETLPAPFARTYFSEQLGSVIRGEPAPRPRPGVYRVPPVRLVIRAVILGRWLRRWGTDL